MWFAYETVGTHLSIPQHIKYLKTGASYLFVHLTRPSGDESTRKKIWVQHEVFETSVSVHQPLGEGLRGSGYHMVKPGAILIRNVIPVALDLFWQELQW